MHYNSKCIKFFILAIEYCDNDALRKLCIRNQMHLDNVISNRRDSLSSFHDKCREIWFCDCAVE